MGPCLLCRLAAVRESHEGSGGGFTVVRFLHLVVENNAGHAVQRVALPYRLMKGQTCFQEGTLEVGPVAAGQTAQSRDFIRESAFFDRIDWCGGPVVESDPPLSQAAIKFSGGIPRSFSIGCLAVAIGAGIFLIVGIYALMAAFFKGF